MAIGGFPGGFDEAWAGWLIGNYAGDDPEYGHQQARWPDRQHLADARLETDFEQQDDDADLGDDGNGLIGGEEVESMEPHQHQIAENHTRHQLPQNGRLVGPFCYLAAHLGGHQDDH